MRVSKGLLEKIRDVHVRLGRLLHRHSFFRWRCVVYFGPPFSSLVLVVAPHFLGRRRRCNV